MAKANVEGEEVEAYPSEDQGIEPETTSEERKRWKREKRKRMFIPKKAGKSLRKTLKSPLQKLLSWKALSTKESRQCAPTAGKSLTRKRMML